MPEITNENNKEPKVKKVAKNTTKSSSKKTPTKSSSTTAKKKTTTVKKVVPEENITKPATQKSTKTSSKNVPSTKSTATSKKATKSTAGNTKKTSTTKKVAVKREATTKSTKTDETKRKTKIVKKVPVKKTVKNEKIEDVKVEKKKEEAIKEETVIQKIKNFIAKIVAMQEEARREAEAKKNEKVEKTKKTAKNDDDEKDSKPYMLEYYDLPYRYNETMVKILAQTPKRLFVYWDISDSDRQKYIKAFGERFFEETYPVLLVHNEEKNYTFEVPINDFANSWYLDIKDPKSKYVIELGRKFRTKPEVVNIARTEETKDIVLRNDYVPIVSSNVLEVPNDHILFENAQVKVLFRNVKTNEETIKEIKNIRDIYGNSCDIKEFYEEHYKDEISEGMFDMANPSSRLSSSSFK